MCGADSHRHPPDDLRLLIVAAGYLLKDVINNRLLQLIIRNARENFRRQPVIDLAVIEGLNTLGEFLIPSFDFVVAYGVFTR